MTRHLGELLDAAGAAVRQTRGAVDAVPDVERVRLASTHAADWYVRVEHSLDAGRCAQVLHYPNSRAGVQLARPVAARLRGLGACDSVGVRADPRYVLQQTPCPAIVVQLPGPATSATRAASAHPDSLRRAAAMLLLGLRAAFTPDLNGWTPLEVRSDDVFGNVVTGQGHGAHHALTQIHLQHTQINQF